MVDLNSLEQEFKRRFYILYCDHESILNSAKFERYHHLHDFAIRNKWNFEKKVKKDYFSNKSNIYYNQKLNKIICGRLTTNIEMDSELMQELLYTRNKIILNELVDIEDSGDLNFECFDKVLKPSNKVTSYIASRKMSIFNVENWLKFYIDLYSACFPDYQIYQTKSKIQFLKKVSNNYFGFQFDLRDLTKQIKQGDLTLPNSEIIVSKLPLDKNFQVLSDFSYPLYLEWPSPQTFKTVNQVDSRNNTVKIDFHIVYEEQGDSVLITGDKVFGDLLRKNAKVYFIYSAPFLNSYLNFILTTISKNLTTSLSL